MRKLFLCAILFLSALSARAENPRYKISVTHGGNPLGDIILELFPEAAPLHVNRFDSLVSVGYYNGSLFHRVIPDFMIQGGAGSGALTSVKAEFSSTMKHLRGTLSAARTPDPNSFTSQFFICVEAKPHLDGQYSIFGQVLEGMDVADKIVSVPRGAADRPLVDVVMTVTKLLPSGIRDYCPGASPLLLKTFPNPTEYFSQINFTLPMPTKAKLEIMNATGGKVATLHDGELPEGPQEFTWDASHYAVGNYYFRLETSAGVQTGKIVLLKK